MTIMYRSILKDLPHTLSDLKARGVTVERLNGYVNSRKAFYIDGQLMTDWQIVIAHPRPHSI